MKYIGVILREMDDYYKLNKEVSDMIFEYNFIPLPIIKYDKKLIDMCAGFILQGGLSYNLEDLKIVKYLYDNNIPTLGICLGMQTMSVMKNGYLEEMKTLNHYNSNHYVILDTTSKIYNIIKEEKILVNSRHKDYVIKTSLDVVGKSLDNIIEVVEDKTKDFFIGVEWHPESIYKNNQSSKKIIDYYFNTLKQKHVKQV